MSALLSVKDLTAGYGGVPIIENVDLDVAEHEISASSSGRTAPVSRHCSRPSLP
jgi:ABC-type branched-subunit amino acid transport system ATPase component